MIVWLASYPRSGNSLLRTVLRQTMGLCSLADRSEWPRLLEQAGNRTPASVSATTVGVARPEVPWDEFYPRAIQSPTRFLVKTHEAPLDDQPVIYVVRDGRKAAYSYLQMHRSHTPGLNRTLPQIIGGDDYYGDWSSHYRTWLQAASNRPVLLVRYEDLVQATPETTGRIAAFLDHPETPLPWHNPFEELNRDRPHLFREGRIEWERPPEWTAGIAWAFELFHGPLMRELGYWDSAACKSETASGTSFKEMAREILCLLEHPAVPHRSIARCAGEIRHIRDALEAVVAE